MRLARTLLGGAVLLGALGCTGADRAAYPVEFAVSVKGAPPVGATVVLHPVGKDDPAVPRPTGRVDPAGTVKLSTFAQNDGAPPGEYTVTVTWREQLYEPGPEMIEKASVDKLKGKYGKPTAPNAPRVVVERKDNKLPPLEL
jgi:hypothetical protein